jgi:sulfate adenylyltransferase subunit 1 (EFTu-like GTPase family)
VLAINKMDLVDYDQDAYRHICAEFRSWAARLDVEEVACIPISALKGDNVVDRSERLDWYGGPTLLEYLESAPVSAGVADGPLRLPVQYVIRERSGGERAARDRREARGYAGQLAGGTLRPGDEVVVLPAGLSTRVAAVEGPDGPLDAAPAPLSVTVRLEDEIDAGRGALLVRPGEEPLSGRDVEATVCWLGDNPGRLGGRYLIKHTTRTERARLEVIHHTLHVEDLAERPGADALGRNEIGRVSLRVSSDLRYDPYAVNRQTGAFILIDEASNETVGAGMLADPADHAR